MGPFAKATNSQATAIGGEYVTASGFGSLAFGSGSRATGTGSTALGYDAEATANYALALGGGSRARATYTSAIGDGAVADGANSTVIGKSSSTASTHTDSFAIGNAVQTSAANQISIGSTLDTVRISETYTLPTSDGTNGQVLTTDGSGAVTFADAGGGGAALELYAENPSSPTAPSATGTNAVAIGNGSTATNTDAFAIGRLTDATGSGSVAIGYSVDATGLRSLAIGAGTDATSSYASAIGTNSGNSGSQAVTGAGAMALGGSYASGTDSFAAAIANNTSSFGATGANSVAIGANAKSQSFRSIAIGRAAVANAESAVAIGTSIFASGVSSVTIGTNCSAESAYGYASGFHSHTEATYGKKVYASGRFSGTGDAQTGTFVLRSDTTDATPEALTTDNSAAGTTDQIILPNNSAYAFHGTIVAREQASAGTDCAAWKIEGLIRREGSAGTTVLVNSATTVLDNTPAWGMALSADTTNGGLKIEVTGAAATNIRFVATISTSEVSY